MMVINDNPIKTVDSFAFAGLKNVKFLLLSSSVRHLHTVGIFKTLLKIGTLDNKIPFRMHSMV